jgi:sigma-B regulation protein RsbU (phosphoserine phosphatase)
LVDRTLDVEATLDSLRTVGLWLRDATRDAGVPYEVAFGLDLAVHEAVENVIRHGSHDGALIHLRLRFRCDHERVEVVIVDDGRAFDPLSVPAPTMPQRIEDVIPGGQGIHLMRHFTDEVRYRRERGQNVLTLARALPSRDGAMSDLDLLAGSPFFEGLGPDELQTLRRAGRFVRLGPGEVVLRPGDQNRALHFVLAGTLEVRLEESSSAVSRIQKGECFGEMSIIEGRTASAWVVAVETCEILRVSEEQVFSDLLPQPGFARGLLRLLSGRLRRSLERQASWEELRKELRLAQEIQASMLPPAGALFPEHPEVDCAAAMDPAAEVGGDFYDAFFLDERHLFFAVGDAAGKGIGAALFMARSLALLRAEALRRRALHDTLGRVNEALARGNEQATFVALFCAVLDTVSGALRYANGGGGAPFVRGGGQWSRLTMPRGIVAGAIPGFTFESARARLAPGDVLVLFSDGVTEATSPEGELFGAERLKDVLVRAEGKSSLALIDAVRTAVRAFARGGSPADDLTLLVVRRPLSAVPEPAPSTKKNGVD